jgi:hypothetical protein
MKKPASAGFFMLWPWALPDDHIGQMLDDVL